MIAFCTKCKSDLTSDNLSTVHLHLLRAHNLTVGEAVEQCSEVIEFREAQT